MKTVKFNFAGKAWEVEANNSGWIAPGAPKELVELLKKAPRHKWDSSSILSSLRQTHGSSSVGMLTIKAYTAQIRLFITSTV